MSAEERVRLELGWAGGQTLVVSVPLADADRLEHELGAGEGRTALETEDGRCFVSLAGIAYVKRAARESRLGFGNR